MNLLSTMLKGGPKGALQETSRTLSGEGQMTISPREDMLGQVLENCFSAKGTHIMLRKELLQKHNGWKERWCGWKKGRGLPRVGRSRSLRRKLEPLGNGGLTGPGKTVGVFQDGHEFQKKGLAGCDAGFCKAAEQ